MRRGAISKEERHVLEYQDCITPNPDEDPVIFLCSVLRRHSTLVIKGSERPKFEAHLRGCSSQEFWR